MLFYGIGSLKYIYNEIEIQTDGKQFAPLCVVYGSDVKEWAELIDKLVNAVEREFIMTISFNHKILMANFQVAHKWLNGTRWYRK